MSVDKKLSETLQRCLSQHIKAATLLSAIALADNIDRQSELANEYAELMIVMTTPHLQKHHHALVKEKPNCANKLHTGNSKAYRNVEVTGDLVITRDGRLDSRPEDEQYNDYSK